MIKIDAMVREDVMEDLKDALDAMNVRGMTISQVMGCGTQMGCRERVRGTEVDVTLMPKIKFEIVVSSKTWADEVIETICRVAHTGEHGDGKIFVYELMDSIRIRTGEHGPKSLWAKGQISSEIAR
jgi:nitrogen regulatory protein P-II 1